MAGGIGRAAVLGGRRYLEGGGIEGDNCILIYLLFESNPGPDSRSHPSHTLDRSDYTGPYYTLDTAALYQTQ